jgi:hypothetical protein
MPVKSSPQSKRYRAVFEVTFESPTREGALARAKEVIDVPNSKLIRVQEANLAWLTVPGSEKVA